MRHKDFGATAVDTFSDNEVEVSTTVLDDSRKISTLEKKNETWLENSKATFVSGGSKSRMFTVRYQDQIVGQVILWNFLNERDVKSCSISYWIDQDFAGRGITPKAVRMVVDDAFSSMGIDEIDASIHPNNKASVRVIEKLGYKYRTMVGEFAQIDKYMHSQVLYTITKERDADVSV